MYLFSLPA
jgi:hypothetical protein